MQLILPHKEQEPKLDKVDFEIYKFNNRPRPGRNKTLIISCFSEFGCEVLGCLYCIPRLLKRYPGRYIVAMGWHGRDYLYRHLVDEFWEIKEEYMWLREYTRAFHHISQNLKVLEEEASNYGTVIPTAALSKYVVGNYCITCGAFWNEWRKYTEVCPRCQSTNIVRSILTDIKHYKPTAVRIPLPSSGKMEWAKNVLRPKSVGVFARARTTYGRNLDADFYVRLVRTLEEMGYHIVWLGENQSTLPCPVEHVLDFSGLRDLESTLAIIANLEFTVQFWTASSRLSGIVGTPFIIVESPEQIYCAGLMAGQEGKRLELTTFGPKKLITSHYFNVKENPEQALDLIKRAVIELQQGNYDEIVGMVESALATNQLREDYYEASR
jgi:hypothetical protein